MFPTVQKVYAYIVQDGDLVLFEEPDFPEVGRQVPGGTVEPGEALDQAMLREAEEETGLSGLRVMQLLGNHQENWPPEKPKAHYDCYYYYLQCDEPIPAQWDHIEHFANNGAAPILFRFHRVPLSEAHTLTPHFARFIDALRQVLTAQ